MFWNGCQRGAHRTRAGQIPAGHRRWCTMRLARALGLTTAAVVLLATAACGGDSLEDSGTDNGDGGSADKGSVVVGGQDFTEMQVMAAIYQKVLENEGYTVETKLVTTRDVYLPELSNGNVDIVPDYLAGITDFLNTEKNGPDAAAGLEQRRRRDARGARAARRGEGHLDPAAVRRHRPERLLRVPGVRRRQRPRDPVRPGRAGQADQARRAAGLRGPRRLRGRADRRLRA